MVLKIDGLLPTYFDDSRSATSDIWGKAIVFDKGDLIKIVAPSGSGKTSLIHFLYGLRNEYKGIVNYDNRPLRDFDREQLALLRKDHFSVVLQDMRLFGEQTVLQNLEIKRQLNPYHDAEAIPRMVERLGISSKLNSLCKNCSYGEQQRVAIIRSVLQPFDYLLLDEPFSHLDNNNAKKAMDLMLEEAQARNASIIFADLERIEFFPYTKIYHL